MPKRKRLGWTVLLSRRISRYGRRRSPTAQTQATKVKQEVVIGDQHVARRHGKARAQGARGTTTAIHVGLGLDQQHWLARPSQQARCNRALATHSVCAK